MLNEILPPMRGRGPLPEIHAVTALGEGYWLAGDDKKAKTILESSFEHSERVGYKWYLGWAQRILGEISKKTETTRAVYHFERSLDVFREIKAENELALSCAAYGKFHKQQGDIGESRAHFNAALEIFERLGTPIEPEKVKKELLELPNA